MPLRLMFSSRPYRSLLLLAASAVLAAALAGCMLLDTPGYIAYAVGEPGSRDIVVSMPDGSDRRLITGDAAGQGADDFAPVWSPSRQLIAFLSNRDGNVEVYVAVADGSSFTRATNTSVDESQVVWSPDSERIAYVSETAEGTSALYWLSLSNLVPDRLLLTAHGETQPAWSPSGEWIAFVILNEEGESTGITLRNPDTVDRIQLSQSMDYAPAWSPDSKHVAFVSLRDGDEEVYVVEVGESGPAGAVAQVTDNQGVDTAPQWSPDGNSIAFISDRSETPDIFSSSPDGRDLIALISTDQENEVGFAWGPNGWLVVETAGDGWSKVSVRNPDGEVGQRSSPNELAATPDW